MKLLRKFGFTQLNRVLLFLFMAALMVPLPAAAEEPGQVKFSIVDKPLSEALKLFAVQADMDVMFGVEGVDTGRRYSLEGWYKPLEALSILLRDTGLEYLRDGDRGIAVRRRDTSTDGLANADGLKRTASDEPAGPPPQGNRNAGNGPEADAGNRVLEEIVVTAQKREESIQDVGIAITAWSGEQIEALGAENSYEIAEMTPGVSRAGVLGGQTNLFAIRGVVQNDFTDSTESPVAVYIDQAYVPMMQGQTFSLFDVERVEVLRGPQGTLFGRNATGGLVHFVTRRPTRETEGYLEATYGSYDQARVTGVISGALGELVSGRLSAIYNRYDEIMKNEYPLSAPGASIYPFGVTGPGNPKAEDGWNDDTWAVRGQLLFEPSSDVEILVSGFGSRTDTSEAPYKSAATVPIVDAQGRVVNSVNSSATNVCEAISAETGGCYQPGLEGFDGELLPTSFDVGAVVFGLPPAAPEDGLRPVPGGDFFGYRDPFGDNFHTSKDFSPNDSNKFESYGATASLTWDLGASTLTAVSNFMHFDKLAFVDAVPGPAPQFVFQTKSDEDTFSQELRLNGEHDRLRWTAGFYYLFIGNDTVNGLVFPVNSPFLGLTNLPDGSVLPGVYVPFLGAEANNEISLDTNSYSLFGQLDYALTDMWSITGGLRAVVEDKDYAGTITAYINTDDAKVETGPRLLGSGIDGMGTLRTPFDDKTSATLWAGKLQLEFRPMDDWMFYAGVNRGVKAGGFNAKLPDNQDFLRDEQIPYGEEVLTSYEVGFKSTLFGGTTTFNGSAFYYDYKDYQAFIFLSLSGIIVNNDANMKGAEFELVTRPLEGLDLMMNVSFLDAEVENLQIAPGVFRNTRPSFTPEVQWSGMARFQWGQPVFGGSVALQASANYSSNFYHNIRNFDSQKFAGYVVGNVRLMWTSADEHWVGTMFVDNVANEHYKNIGFDISAVCGCSQESYAPPRWAGLTLRYEY